MTVAQSSLSNPRQVQRSRGLAWPVLLIALGLIFLLDASGYLGDSVSRQLLQLWPFAFVLLGVDLLMRERSLAAALAADAAVVVLAVLFAIFAPLTSLPVNFFGTTDPSTVTVARESASQLDLTLGYGAGRFELSGGGTDLVSVNSTQDDVRLRTVSRSGSTASVTIEAPSQWLPFARGDRAWRVAIPSDIPTSLTLNLGAGEMRIDLTGVRVVRATINQGASDMTLIPPKPTGDVQLSVSSGASSITVEVPAGVEYRVRMTGAANSLSGRDESAGYATATNRVTFVINGGATSVTVR